MNFIENVKDIIRNKVSWRTWYWCCCRYYKAVVILSEIRWMFTRRSPLDPYNIPIIINNYNRLSYLRKMTDSLTGRGYHNIIILDNASTYAPLLEYYERCEFEIIRLERNYGFRALWESGVYERFKKSYYVYTDSDMEIIPECPKNFMTHFLDILKRHPFCFKVGFGICIDDIPSSFPFQDKVVAHESVFWKNQIEPNVFEAGIDTTFALYRPYTHGASSPFKFMLRTGMPYLVRHLPWYEDWSNLDKEQIYYLNNVEQSTHWSVQCKKFIAGQDRT